jgi:hypothetical protein
MSRETLAEDAMKTIAILIPVLTLLLAHRTELQATDVAAKKLAPPRSPRQRASIHAR